MMKTHHTQTHKQWQPGEFTTEINGVVFDILRELREYNRHGTHRTTTFIVRNTITDAVSEWYGKVSRDGRAPQKPPKNAELYGLGTATETAYYKDLTWLH